MNDLIRKSKLIEEILEKANTKILGLESGISLGEMKEWVDNQPTVESPTWIPCSKRLPEEHDSIFKKAKGTDKWRSGMFESISDDVNVTVEFEDSTRTTKTSRTLDGKWKCEKEYGIKMKVIAWQPFPEPYKGD